MAHNVKYLTTGRDKVINAPLHAKSEYAMIFLNPAYERVLGEREARRASGEPQPPPTNELDLLVEGADPAWDDVEAALRETVSLLIGSVDTITQTLVNLVRELHAWFAQHPEDAKLRTDSDFPYRTLRESIRIHASTPLLGRVAGEDLELASGIKIKAGQHVAIYHSLASLDPSVYGPDADHAAGDHGSR